MYTTVKIQVSRRISFPCRFQKYPRFILQTFYMLGNLSPKVDYKQILSTKIHFCRQHFFSLIFPLISGLQDLTAQRQLQQCLCMILLLKIKPKLSDLQLVSHIVEFDRYQYTDTFFNIYFLPILIQISIFISYRYRYISQYIG